MLVHCAENSRALKGLVKSTLPVIWKANKKAWVTAFTLKGLEEAFESMKNMINNIFESQDSNFERSRKVAADVNKEIACYHEIYNEKKKLDEFFRKKKDETPIPSTSNETAMSSI